MKRLRTLFAAAAAALVLCTSAFATGSAEIIRAFIWDGTLYTYMEIDSGQPITRAEAKAAGQTLPGAGRLETVRQAGSPVTWLLLVDNSNSMPDFREDVAEFARSLAGTGGEGTNFYLATFGGAFSVLGEELDAEALSEQIAAIPFDERVTRLHTALDQALDWFEALPRRRNELRCLVVLTDAVQYDPDGGVPYEELLARLEGSDVMLHSLGFGDDEGALESLGGLVTASGGLHQRVDGGLTAGEAAEALVSTAEALFVTGFDLSGLTVPGGMERVSVTLASGGELVCRAETEVAFPAMEGAQDEAPPQPETPALPESPAGAQQSAPPADPAQPQPESGGVLVIAATAAAILLVLAVFLLRRRGKKGAAEPPAPVPPPSNAGTGIYMRMEVLSGQLAGGGTELDLQDELLIGSGPDCAISFQSGGVSPRHARLFQSEGAVMLEDLGAPGGTRVNGAAVDAPRLLRSGDAIEVGNVRFVLKF